MKDEFKTKIIEPLLNLAPRTVDPDDFLSIIFNTNTRVISSYYVRHGFKMPGLYMEYDIYPTQGDYEAYRSASRNDYLTVRIDDTKPNIVNVELHGHVFYLIKDEWKQIRKHLILSKGHEEI